MSAEQTPDVMDRLAGLPARSPVAELRRQRPDVVRHTQDSDSAIFAPRHDGGLSHVERAAAALQVAILLDDAVLQQHYRMRLAQLGGAEPKADARWSAVLAHLRRVTIDPDSATKADLDALLAVGLSLHAVVSLSQVIAYVNFQSRVLAGLRMLRGAA